MLKATVDRLRCPKRGKSGQECRGKLSIAAETPGRAPGEDVLSGSLDCARCSSRFPILGGVAILVQDVRAYLLEHAKGISRLVKDSEIPKAHRAEFVAVRRELEAERVHIEDDLEAERIVALYSMNHYLAAGDGSAGWWKPRVGEGSPWMEELILRHWDRGPFARIQEWAEGMSEARSVIELGCGVGGLSRRLRAPSRTYLGVDSSFASIALARHLALGAPGPASLRIPNDLLQGPVSREIAMPGLPSSDGTTDFVVGDLESLPVARGEFDLSIALNAIDMLPEPAILPELQHSLLKAGGTAIQSGPYIWHESVASELRARLPKEIQDSASAVEWLYRQAGFRIEERVDHLPWLFFKHVRQLELYSVHLFRARKSESL